MAGVVSTLPPTERADSTRTVLIFAAVIAALYYGSEILVPIALAILLSFVLAPTVRALHKIGLGRTLPVGIAVLLAFMIIGGLLMEIASQVRDLSGDLPRYEATMVHKIQLVKGMSDGGGIKRLEQAVARLTKALNRSAPVDKVAQADNGNAPGPNAAANTDAAAAAPLPVQIVTPSNGPIETILIVAAPLLHPLATAFIVLIFVVFILLQREDLRNRAIRLFGAGDLQRTTATMDDGAKRLSRYLLTQCAVNACAGTVVGISLWLIGVPSPILLGILFACLRFIPYVGPVMGALLPLLLAAAVDPGWSMVVWTAAVLFAVEATVGQVVEPFAYGHNTGLSPIAIVIAATFWTVLWGPVGLFLSTPLTVCLVVLGRHVEHLAFLEVLLGDRPALSPSETLYQRMLANDPIEAFDQAQRCLAEMSLSEYYDNVALPALLLAQDDAAQDRLDLAQQTKIKETALEVIENLEHDEPDAEHPKRHFWSRPKAGPDGSKAAATPDDLLPETVPEALRAEGSVFCVGGRSPLDDASASMLAEVFRCHDIGAASDSYASLSKTSIDALDLSNTRIIIVSTLDGSSAAFLRFVLRRLRRHAPHAKIIVGAWWRRDGLRDTDEEIDSLVKDPKVSTFLDAIRFCLAQTALPVEKEAAPAPRTVVSAAS